MNLLLIILLTQSNAIPMKKASCSMDNHPYILIHRDGTQEEKEDWYVRCKVTVDGKVQSEETLPLAHPTEFKDAAAAAREYVKKK